MLVSGLVILKIFVSALVLALYVADPSIPKPESPGIWPLQDVTGVGYFHVTLTWGITRLQKICTEPYLFPVFLQAAVA